MAYRAIHSFFALIVACGFLFQLMLHQNSVLNITQPCFDTSYLPTIQDTTNQYTIVINTYRNRDEHVLELLQHYATCKAGRLDRVVLVWNDMERPVPTSVATFSESNQYAIEIMPSSNLTNRFILFPSIRTDAIFSQDDDVRYSCEILENAFDVWLENLDLLVGFAPRILERKANNTYSYGMYRTYNREDGGFYNIILPTKGSFLHRRFHELFFKDSRLDATRNLVNELVTGEDILMAFFHALYTPPLHLRAVAASRLTDFGIPDGFQETSASLGRSTHRYRHRIFDSLQSMLNDIGSGGFLFEKDHTNQWCWWDNNSNRTSNAFSCGKQVPDKPHLFSVV